MAWYEIINAKSDSFVADRDAEDLLRHLATALQTEDDESREMLGVMPLPGSPPPQGPCPDTSA
jgi:hypothetical protein